MYKWRIWCDTEKVYQYVCSSKKPEHCIHDYNHIIGDIDIIRKVEGSLVSVNREATLTGGNYRCETAHIEGGNGITTINKSWPYPINIISMDYVCTNNEGDSLAIGTVPQLIGHTKKDVRRGDNIFMADNDVVNKLEIGDYVVINDKEVGRLTCVGYDSIKTENPYSSNTISNATIKKYRSILENYEIGPPGKYTVCKNKKDGIYIPAGTELNFCYLNFKNSPIKLVIRIEYLFFI